MVYKEEERDLFSVPEEYYLAHCISADFGMRAGIVVAFNENFDMKRILQTKYPKYLQLWQESGCLGDCILEGRVLNLITKERCSDFPTYGSLQTALCRCKTICLKEGIKKIAMPLIGCGIDQLKWEHVSEIIKNVFHDTAIEVLVCIWK